MSSHSAESYGEHLDDVVHVYFRGGTAVGGDPEEESVEATDAHLEGSDGHGETGLASGGFEGELVGDVVVVVADVPEEEVRKEGDVHVLEGTADAAAGGDGRVRGGGEGGGEGGGDIDRLDEGGSVAESVEGSGELTGGL